MNILKNQNEAFTLVEVIIAVLLSSIIITGIYSAFNALLSSKEQIDIKSSSLIENQALQKIIASDIRMMQKELIDQKSDNEIIYIKTHNSLFFNKSLPVNIVYTLEDNTLYRKEYLEEMDYEMKLPLLRNIDKFEIKTFENGDYTEGFKQKGAIFKIIYETRNKKVEFIAARIITSI